jgi:uncharacterized cupredoxin-like copper-binding protein
MSTSTVEKAKTTQAEPDQAGPELLRARAERAEGRLFAVLIILAALIAVTAGLAVFAVIGGNDNGTVVMHARGGGNAGASNMPRNMGSQMGGGTQSANGGSTAPAGAGHMVHTTLGEYFIRPDVASIPAGKVTFTARNGGQIQHELMVERMPIKMDGPMQPNEDAAQGMISDMAPGESGKMTLNLRPGNYMLFCNITGHYAAGQHTMFRVTG